jgi:hypothetical protein
MDSATADRQRIHPRAERSFGQHQGEVIAAVKHLNMVV